MKKLVKSFMLLTLLCLTLVACVNPANTTGPTGSSQTADARTMTVGITQFPSGIDPHAEYSGWETVRFGVGETLFRLNAQLQPEPWLAAAAERQDDTTWVIQLKKDVVFHNGKPMTATAVKQSLERTLANNARAEKELAIASITADDTQMTVTITTTEPLPTLLNSLAEPFSTIIDTTELSAVETMPVGTGPFQVKQFTAEQSVQLTANKQYHNGEVKTSDLLIKRYTDANSLTLALQAGEVDAAIGIPYGSLMTFNDANQFTISESSATRIVKFYYNLSQPFLNDVNFRRALNTITDKSSYVSSLFKDSATVATAVFPSITEYGDNTLLKQQYAYDIAAAKTMLAEAGYRDTDGDGIIEKDGQPVKLKMTTYNRLVEMPLAAQAFQQAAKEVGIDIEVVSVEKISEPLKSGQFDISTYSMIVAPTGDPYAYFNNVVKTGGASNFGTYSNATVDAQIETLAHTFDATERKNLAITIQNQLIDDAAFNYIGHVKMVIVMKKGVTGITAHPSDFYYITHETSIAK